MHGHPAAAQLGLPPPAPPKLQQCEPRLRGCSGFFLAPRSKRRSFDPAHLHFLTQLQQHKGVSPPPRPSLLNEEFRAIYGSSRLDEYADCFPSDLHLVISDLFILVDNLKTAFLHKTHNFT